MSFRIHILNSVIVFKSMFRAIFHIYFVFHIWFVPLSRRKGHQISDFENTSRGSDFEYQGNLEPYKIKNT